MQPATLGYLVRNDEVLLISKKRGLGEGKYVGSGGKVEDGETPREAAIREVEVEIRVTVTDPTKVGEFEFVFGDIPKMFVHVYRAEEFAGEPRETAEARPEWFEFDAIPHDEMWEDDRYWMPYLFSGETFVGEFVFDAEGDELRRHELETAVAFDR